MWGHLSPCHEFPGELELDWWYLRDLSVWSSASPRAYLGLLSYLICKSEGSVVIWEDSALKGFLHLLLLQPSCWESNLMLGKRWSAQVPWELGPGEPGDWEPSFLSSLPAGQCSFILLLAVVFLFIQPFNQYLQTFM